MTEQYFTLIKGKRAKRWGKDLGAYLTLSHSERVELKSQLDAVEKEFIKLHIKNLRPYGTVFGADAARGYPKPFMSGDNMPKGAALHPKKTPRDAEGKAKIPDFSKVDLYGHFIELASDRVRNIIEALEPEKYLFFPYELRDTQNDRTLQYWLIYALTNDPVIDFPASLYSQSEKGGWSPTALTFDQVYKLDAALVKGRHLILCPEVGDYIFSKTFVDAAGSFLLRNQELEELEVVSGGMEQ